MYSFCFFNNEIIPGEQAQVPINDLALLRGFGIFDYFRTYDLKPFLLDAYLKRFFHSAAAMDLKLDLSTEELKVAIDKLLKFNNITTDVGVRMILTGGATDDSMTASEPTFFIMVEPMQPFDPQNFVTGVKLVTQEFLRQFPEVKTTNYINAVKYWKDCKAAGAIDILYFFENKVLETSRSNIFIVKDKKVITPDKNILLGCTRNFVLSFTRLLYDVEERAISINELWDADEVFITGTTKKITPVVDIDGRHIKKGIPGQVTKHLMSEFDKNIKEHN